MDSVLTALAAGISAVLGVLIASWHQANLQRSLTRAESIRSWQHERRTSYLKFLVTDDEFYRSIAGMLRDDHPGWNATSVDESMKEQIVSPRSLAEREEIISKFDQVWRAGRAIELYHLVDDDLLASAKSVLLVDAELVGLVVFDMSWYPDKAPGISIQIVNALQKRRSAIDVFMHAARAALDVPPTFDTVSATRK